MFFWDRIFCYHRTLEFNHDFDWDVEILDEEKVLNRELISEAIHIKKQRNGLNIHKVIPTY